MTEARVTYVLSVRQPWAHAIFHNGKDIENRTWKPRKPCRLLIHAAKTFDEEGLERLEAMRMKLPATFPVGDIIGAVDYLGWVTNSDSDWAISGYYQWMIARPQRARPPIPVLGRPTLFRPPPGWRDSFRGLKD